LKKIITVIGARPQFIKAATVSRAIRKTGMIREIIIHTGQHFDNNMSSVFFTEMEIPKPDFNLEVNNLSHGAMTGRMLEKIEDVLRLEVPDMVMVYGDTNSTLAGALAAKKLGIRVAHVEAGLRSFNMQMPEEINRILTDRISDLLFCPTDTAVNNLQNEGYQNFNCNIQKVGDVMYDAALFYGAVSSNRSDIINILNLTKSKFILCTIHRQENTDNIERLSSLVSVLNDINREIPVVLPLHPRTRKIFEYNHIKLGFEPIEPVGYFDIVELLKNCSLVMTDSGGMQKEAYFFNKYCLTLRTETEWIELVSNNYNFLVGYDPFLIKQCISNYLGKTINNPSTLFGNGNASELIVELLLN
jgi:UDP-GlcNAc3NAcA epimerase